MTEPKSETIEGEDAPIPGQHARGGTLERDGHSPFPVVGVGASAGGLEAFGALLAHLPADTGMAFLLVQHLDPHHESRLSDLLSRHSDMPVLEATNGLAVRANHVYVIPPNANLAISQGVLLISPRGEARGPHLPVDYLFRSLAEDQQGRAIGVVLSGTGSDGTLGLCEIKAVGGITFAQEEQDASHAGMPRSAIESGCVDFVNPVEGIARRLVEIGKHPYLGSKSLSERFQEEASDALYKKILAAVRAQKGVDFGLYRDTTIKRRILRRMALRSQRHLADYAHALADDPGEVEALYNDLLINVTSFFRDPAMFEALKHKVFPEIARVKHPTAPVRVWVPGCSTGQEAYSLAITLIEFFDGRPTRPQIQLFATDLSDETALERARAGVYPETIEAEVTPERLHRFFRREDHVYRVDKTLRDMCVFARQNVTADPPFSHLDLISCRNVLIYLASPLQRRVLPTFHYALNATGYLVLGTAESVGDSADLFEMVDREHKIYSKKATASRVPTRFPRGDARMPAAAGRRPGPMSPEPVDFARETDRLLLGRYAPPGVLVNENFDVVQYRGRTAPFLEVPPGEPTTNVFKLARDGLLIELRNALGEAKRLNKSVRREQVPFRRDGDTYMVALEVTPIVVHGGDAPCYLVLFEEREPGSEPHVAALAAAALEERTDPEREIVRLGQELTATREYMQSLSDQQDAANDELRSANEEILSSNEELQSTNEELETAKEELQSANEELTTVNEQLQHRNVELGQLNSDLTNLFGSTNIPVVMISGDLKIRRFTQPARRVLNLLPTDIGRPIADLRPTLLVPDFLEMIAEVIQTAEAREREVQAADGPWFAMRVSPYRTTDDRIDGVVIVLVDIDHSKRAQAELREADRRKDEFLATLAHELRNPIAPIRNALEIMRLTDGEPGATRLAHEVLQRQVKQLSRIVDDLIDVSRIVERKVELRPQTVALEGVIEMAVETSRSFIEACRHQLTVSLPPQPVALNADQGRLAQVFVNLLNNAAKYMKPGGRIWLSAERVPAPHGSEALHEIRISVRDAGSGIDPDLLPRIFDMFTQGSTDLEHGRGGLGIGLTLAKNLVEMHGGRIEVQSEGVGKGSEFLVYLPLTESRSLAAPAAAPGDPVANGVPERRRILVVDDNPDQARSLHLLLELLGHEVRVAADGPSALAAVEGEAPDIALVDIGLPGMSGYEVAIRIRERREFDDVVLVAHTGWGQEHDRHRSVESGFDHHLVKPIDLVALQGILAIVKSRS